jgi:1-acyl-sn-glycerol-3-phosphate acyltransferase
LFYWVVKLLLIPLVHLVFRPVVEGRENVPADGPVIMASNHLSFVDSFVIPLLAPRRVHFLAKAEYFTATDPAGRLRGAFFRAVGAVPVERGSHRAAQASLDTALKVLAEREGFGIHPEGTRSRDGRLYRGRTGVAWLALTAQAPVVPVGLLGTDRMWPIGARFPRVRRITVRFGAPLDFSDLYGQARSGQVRRRVTDEIMDAIAELTGQERVDHYNEVPEVA